MLGRLMSKLMKQEPPRIFVGTLDVAPGRGLARRFEGLAGAVPPSLDRALQAELNELFPLPSAATVDAARPTDLAFDVTIQRYRFGSATELSLGEVDIPMYWRPKVQLAARLYLLQSRKTRAAFRITQKMPWKVYLGRVLSWRVFVGLEPLSRRSDLEHLLRQAAQRVMARLRDST